MTVKNFERLLYFSILLVALLLFQGDMTAGCQCPDTSCMQLAHTARRCECCVFTFLGKRSPKPAVNAYSKKESISSYSSFADQNIANIDYWFRLSGLSDMTET
ncbi:uncharacterized protein LOC134257163 [Saccostrea cucullata]|uniref:uncharacterized protein LOC134257163 n=1 Tax=Saccostrea cuccullata TaxID=36930 RepID=UPI002ED1BFB2